MSDSAVAGPLLWGLLGLFVLRVLGQVLVVLFQPRWLPPMRQWYSGLIPYRYLLPIQIVFILVMGSIARSAVSEQGVLAGPHRAPGRGLVAFSFVYAASMVVRYVLRMARRPEERWLGGTIPIVFHVVLAAFLCVYGSFLSR